MSDDGVACPQIGEASWREIDRSVARVAYRAPSPGDDKYSRGVVSLVTGSADYPGAGVLSAAGAFGGCVGLVRYLGGAKKLVLQRFPEVVCRAGRADACVFGSGWGGDLVESLRGVRSPVVVVDAGAMEHFDLWQRFPMRVFTPHHGEAARLLEVEPGRVDDDPQWAAAKLVSALGGVVVLKGATTLVAAPSCVDNPWFYSARSHWAATAGSGDVLAGLIGATIAGMKAADEASVLSAVLGSVWVHAQAAWSTKPILASQIASEIPSVIGGLLCGS